MKSSVFGRSLQLITMASKLAQKELGRSVHKGLAGDYDGSSLVKTRVDQARVLAENLSQLKGAAMKAGQLLSIDSSDFLPLRSLRSCRSCKTLRSLLLSKSSVVL
jgi:aarF domain-containing kinase